MPALEPFTGHVVAPAHAEHVVIPPFDSLSEEQRERGRSDPDSFLGVLPPRREQDASLLRECRAHLERLLATGRFEPLDRPALAVLRISDERREATGVVGDVDAGAFVGPAAGGWHDGAVAPHERVRPDTVRALRRHLEIVGAVSSPVCVAHRPDAAVARLLARITDGEPRVAFSDPVSHVRLWLVDDPARRDELSGAVAGTGDWLIADGHHRAEAARSTGRVLCVVMADDQLGVRPFHRRVRTHEPDRAGAVLRDHGLQVTALEGAAPPLRPGEVTVGGGERWWRVRLPPLEAAGAPVDALDAVRAERAVLTPLLGVGTDDATGVLDDPRVEAVPPTTELARLPRPGTVAVVLHPATLDEVRRVVASGATMPPKSTYVVPKQRSGLLVVPRGAAGRGKAV